MAPQHLEHMAGRLMKDATLDPLIVLGSNLRTGHQSAGRRSVAAFSHRGYSKLQARAVARTNRF
ncbi:MAG: hypothetical protein WAM44_13620 [Chthoniobacterales bacterium]